jgi:hypothetical protein
MVQTVPAPSIVADLLAALLHYAIFKITGRRTSCEIKFGRSTRSIRSGQSGPIASGVRRLMAVLPPVFSLVAENLRRRDRAMA